jgi:ribosomal-protein-serine acetyltransferase
MRMMLESVQQEGQHISEQGMFLLSGRAGTVTAVLLDTQQHRMRRYAIETNAFGGEMFSRALGDDAELRPLEPWQAGEFAAYIDRVRDALKPWIPWADSIVDEASARAFLQNYADRQAADTGRIFGLYVSGVLQGGVIYRTFNTAQGVCELGVWLAPEMRGRGLITLACRELIAWALDVRGMVRVEWLCDPRNEASIAAARRLGFAHEGTHRKAFYLDGEHRDVQVWAVIS